MLEYYPFLLGVCLFSGAICLFQGVSCQTIVFLGEKGRGEEAEDLGPIERSSWILPFPWHVFPQALTCTVAE